MSVTPSPSYCYRKPVMIVSCFRMRCATFQSTYLRQVPHNQLSRARLGSSITGSHSSRHRTIAMAKAVKLLVVSSPDSPELSVLKDLPPSVEVIGIGQTVRDLHALTEEQWASVDVLLNAGVGAKAGKRDDIKVHACQRAPCHHSTHDVTHDAGLLALTCTSRTCMDTCQHPVWPSATTISSLCLRNHTPWGSLGR